MICYLTLFSLLRYTIPCQASSNSTLVPRMTPRTFLAQESGTDAAKISRNDKIFIHLVFDMSLRSHSQKPSPMLHTCTNLFRESLTETIYVLRFRCDTLLGAHRDTAAHRHSTALARNLQSRSVSWDQLTQKFDTIKCQQTLRHTCCHIKSLSLKVGRAAVGFFPIRPNIFL